MMNNKKALVLGAGGFIGGHMVDRLISEGYFVRGVDKKYPDFSETTANEFEIFDLTSTSGLDAIFAVDGGFDEVYQFAADMGGATYINCGDNDANVLCNSVTINVNTAQQCIKNNIKKIFFPSSACVYNSINGNATCLESEVYPAFPDNEYGWEKLFSERMYGAFRKNYGLDVKIARFHSIVGPRAQWKGGKEKAHSALIRKFILCGHDESIDVIGDGTQTRTFLYIDDCIDAVLMLMNSEVTEVVNIGSDDLISINQYLNIIKEISDFKGIQYNIRKNVKFNYIDGPTGVIGRSCNTDKINQLLGWKKQISTYHATYLTYDWIKRQIDSEQ